MRRYPSSEREPIRKRIGPTFIEPMQCNPVTALPAAEKWTFEIKFDGYRCIAVKRGRKANSINDGKPVDHYDKYTNSLMQTARQVESSPKSVQVFLNELARELALRDFLGTTLGLSTESKALAYGTTVNDFFGRAASFVGGWASIQHLANWVTATKDLISGQIFNAAILGTTNYIKGFWNSVIHPFRSINDAMEQGIIFE